MSNIFEKLRNTDDDDRDDKAVSSVSNDAPAAEAVQPKDLATRKYTREELLALYKPDYEVPKDFSFMPGVTSAEALPPVALAPDLHNQDVRFSCSNRMLPFCSTLIIQ